VNVVLTFSKNLYKRLADMSGRLLFFIPVFLWKIAEYQSKIKLKFSPFSRQHSPCIPLSGIFSRLH
jgi:hypothetical protein